MTQSFLVIIMYEIFEYELEILLTDFNLNDMVYNIYIYSIISYDAYFFYLP